MSDHISYNEVLIWNQCPYRHKLQYTDNIKLFHGNIFTVFGTCVHESCQSQVKSKNSNLLSYIPKFELCFDKALDNLSDPPSQEDRDTFRKQGVGIIEEFYDKFKEHFGTDYTVAIEDKLFESIENSDKLFKGFIDLNMTCGRDKKRKIIDLKTSTWGWDARTKSDKTKIYQLVLYKYFVSQRDNVDLKDIETYFILLKRTPKKGKKIEIVPITSGNVRVKNAIKWMETMLKSVERGFVYKNRKSCQYCDFLNSKYCGR